MAIQGGGYREFYDARLLGIIVMMIFALPSTASGQAELPPPPAPDRLALEDCLAIALAEQPAIGIQAAAVDQAVAQHRIARSFLLPQADVKMRYMRLDEPRTVDIDLGDSFGAPFTNVFSDSAAFFGIATQAGSTAALNAIDNPNTPIFPGGPTFNSLKASASTLVPETIEVGLLGRDSLASELLVVQPLWTGGKIWKRYQQAELGVEVNRLDMIRTEQTVAFNVVRAYFSILLAEELALTTAEAVRRVQSIESLIDGQLANFSEYVTTAELYRAQSLRHLYNGQRVEFQQGLKRGYAALKLAMGLEQNASIRIADYRMPRHRETLTFDEALARAMSQRAELAQANIGMQVARLETGAAIAEFSPDIALFGRMSTINDDGRFVNPNDNLEWAAGVRAVMPLVVGGRRPAQIARARSQERQARYLRIQIEQLIQQQVQDAILSIEQSLEQWEAARQAVTATTKSLQRFDDLLNELQAQRRHQYFVDLLNVEFLDLTAKVRLRQAIYDYHVSMAQLRIAMGTPPALFASTSPRGISRRIE